MNPLTMRRARFVYEAARIAAIAAAAPILPEPWDQREQAFCDQFCKVIEQQMGPSRSESPEELHGSWVQAYIDMGWTYGPERDTEKKTHPDMVPYAKLGQLEQDKDAVFVALCEIARLWVYDEPTDSIGTPSVHQFPAPRDDAGRCAVCGSGLKVEHALSCEWRRWHTPTMDDASVATPDEVIEQMWPEIELFFHDYLAAKLIDSPEFQAHRHCTNDNCRFARSLLGTAARMARGETAWKRPAHSNSHDQERTP